MAWLEKDRTVAWMIALAFFLAVVTFHDEVTTLAIRLRRSMSVGNYNLLFTAASVAGFIAWMWMILVPRARSKQSSVIYIFLIPTLALVVLCFAFLQSYSIEAVHFFQYAMLAILLFPLLKSYGAAVFLSTVLGIADELYQYLVLTPRFGYLDLNDILLNLVGAGLAAVTIYMTTGKFVSQRHRNRAIMSVTLAILLTALAYLAFHLLGLVRWDSGSTDLQPGWFFVNRLPQSNAFWTEVSYGKSIHILKPWEGILAGIFLSGYYFILDLLPAGKRDEDSPVI